MIYFIIFASILVVGWCGTISIFISDFRVKIGLTIFAGDSYEKIEAIWHFVWHLTQTHTHTLVYYKTGEPMQRN